MKRFIPCVLLAFVCVLALATEGQAFVRRAVEKVVVRNQPQKVIVKDVQKVEVQKIRVQEVREVKRVVFQPVEVVEDYHYQRQAVQIQPVQAFYRVERFSSGYGTQTLNQGYAGCNSAQQQTQQLRQEVEQLKLRVEKQELQQKLTAPPK